MSNALTEPPGSPTSTFLKSSFAPDLASLDAHIAVLGIPYGMPYHPSEAANEQSRAPDAIRQASLFPEEVLGHYDFDLGGHLLDGRDVRIVDCGNVTADLKDPREHYRRAEQAARLILSSGATLMTLGGDHGVPIPVIRALESVAEKVTLVQIDAHLDWRDEVNGEHEGYSSPIRRASELPWIGNIVQIGLRGVGSARSGEVEAARDYGSDLITAYEMHEIGMAAVLDRIPDGGPYYLTIDADGLDPSLMPAVMGPVPGGVSWPQIRTLIHGLANKGRILAMDLVEIAPSRDIGDTTMIAAERLLCNFIGATVRAGYYD